MTPPQAYAVYARENDDNYGRPLTVFKTSRHSKLLFFVKNKGQWNAKSGPEVGDGKVGMWKKCTGRLVSKWERTGRNWSEIGQILHTHTQVTVTVFKTSRHSKLLFFVKNKGQWKAKSGPKVGDGKVAMWKKFTGRLVSKWERTGRNWSNIANTHTDTRA